MDRPKIVNRIGIELITDVCQEYIDEIVEDGLVEDKIRDWNAKIAEAVLEAVFGKSIWEWINSKYDLSDEGLTEAERAEFIKNGNVLDFENDAIRMTLLDDGTGAVYITE